MASAAMVIVIVTLVGFAPDVRGKALDAQNQDLAEAVKRSYLSHQVSGEVTTAMIEAALKALAQMLSPPMRSILWRSIGLALVLITVLAIGLQRLLSWLATSGESWAEAALGPAAHMPLYALSWIVSVAAGLGIVFGAILLMPAITSLVAGFFVDEIADHVEREYYPAERPGTALPFGIAMREGIKFALLSILVYLIALPFVFVAGIGFLAFFIATGWLLGREYFELAAMRFRPPEEAKAMRRDNAATIFTAGLLIAAFVSIPIVNLATPLFGMALMVHMHKLLSGPRSELIEPARRPETSWH
jgi:CysZ protein